MKNKFIENKQDNKISAEQLRKAFSAIDDYGFYNCDEPLYTRIQRTPQYFYCPKIVETSKDDMKTTYTISWDVHF